MISLKVCANGFLYNMARAMAGTVVYCAKGKIRLHEIGQLLEAGRPHGCRAHGAAGGLYMTHLWYDDGKVAFHV